MQARQLDVDLAPLLAKIAACNDGRDVKERALPLWIGEHHVGYCLPGFAQRLRAFPDVFEVGGARVALAGALQTPEARSGALAGAMQALREAGVIRGWRDELYPISPGFHAPPLASVERAAAVHLGIKSYGVHVNGYVERPDGSLELWVGRRSASKSTWPGLLDHVAAGGQPVGISCAANVIKECGEEASIPPGLAAAARACGVVGCEYAQPAGVKRDVLYVYDLQLPPDFTPRPQDGEVSEFLLLPLPRVAELIASTDEFKPNVALVIMDFMVRRGALHPDQRGYLEVVNGLRCGDIS